MNRIQIVERNKASLGLRFANRVIDLICFYIIFFIIFFILSVVGNAFQIEFLLKFLTGFLDEKLLFYLMVYSIVFLYYFLTEFFLKGRTVGKYITGTKAVTLWGKSPNSKQIMKRTLSRLVPFDALSFFGTNGWHDSWSDTRVVKIRDFENAMRMENELENIGKE